MQPSLVHAGETSPTQLLWSGDVQYWMGLSTGREKLTPPGAPARTATSADFTRRESVLGAERSASTVGKRNMSSSKCPSTSIVRWLFAQKSRTSWTPSRRFRKPSGMPTRRPYIVASMTGHDPSGMGKLR